MKHLKSIIFLVLVYTVLRYSGLLGNISHVTQTAAIHSGLLDANVESKKGKETFDYNFTIKDLKGSQINFDQYKGKVVFINLWATWCGPCRAEMPTIQSLFANTSDVSFVILSVDRERDKGKIVSYIQDKQFSFPVFQPAGPLPEILQVGSIPTTFIIAKDGRIASREVGTTNFDTPKFRKFLAKLVNE